MQGQTSLTQARDLVLVPLQGAAGRHLGQYQPLRTSSLRTPWIVQVMWKRRPITVFTRARVQRWSSQPCAVGPLASSRSSTRNCSSLSRGRDGGPAERSACGPPSLQALRHRCTVRTLTRNSRAINAFGSPRSNRPAG